MQAKGGSLRGKMARMVESSTGFDWAEKVCASRHLHLPATRHSAQPQVSPGVDKEYTSEASKREATIKFTRLGERPPGHRWPPIHTAGWICTGDDAVRCCPRRHVPWQRWTPGKLHPGPMTGSPANSLARVRHEAPAAPIRTTLAAPIEALLAAKHGVVARAEASHCCIVGEHGLLPWGRQSQVIGAIREVEPIA
eukprot:2079841-Prymnesium_polylepis.2